MKKISPEEAVQFLEDMERKAYKVEFTPNTSTEIVTVVFHKGNLSTLAYKILESQWYIEEFQR